MKKSYLLILITVFFISACNTTPVNNQQIVQDSKNLGDNSQKQQATEATFQSIVFRGRGDKVSDFFHATPGLLKFKMLHGGRANFAIWLLDSQGDRISLLVNDIGKYSGEKLVTIDYQDDYILDIKADGEWDITISDPRVKEERVLMAVEKKQAPKAVPWEQFFEECKAKYPPQYFKAPLVYKWTDECEKEYAKTYNLPEYCEKVQDKEKLFNCWFQLATEWQNEKYCDKLKGLVATDEVADCRGSVRQNE